MASNKYVRKSAGMERLVRMRPLQLCKLNFKNNLNGTIGQKHIKLFEAAN